MRRGQRRARTAHAFNGPHVLNALARPHQYHMVPSHLDGTRLCAGSRVFLYSTQREATRNRFLNSGLIHGYLPRRTTHPLASRTFNSPGAQVTSSPGQAQRTVGASLKSAHPSNDLSAARVTASRSSRFFGARPTTTPSWLAANAHSKRFSRFTGSYLH